MSAGKDFDTKIPVDLNTDSGFLSGPIDPSYSGDLGAPTNSGVVTCDEDNPDSGLDLCAESFSNLGLSDCRSQTAQHPRLGSAASHIENQDIPPLHVLFQQDEDGDTQLHIAAAHGCEESVGILIKLCPDKAFLNIPNDYRHTALHLAVMGGYSVISRMLVLAGASLAARDMCGKTPLHIATNASNVECLKALLAPILEQPHRKLSAVLNQKDYDGQACVHAAASSGHIKTLQTLVYYGADINAREGLAGWTPLHIAARRGDEKLVQYLLEQCPGAARAARDYGGRTPRRYARKTRAEHLFHKLGADSDSDSDSDDDDYDSEGETLFERLRESLSPINVA